MGWGSKSAFRVTSIVLVAHLPVGAPGPSRHRNEEKITVKEKKWGSWDKILPKSDRGLSMVSQTAYIPYTICRDTPGWNQLCVTSFLATMRVSNKVWPAFTQETEIKKTIKSKRMNDNAD